MSEDAVTRILPGDAGPGPELEKRILREMQRAFRRRAQAAALSLTAAALALACLPEEQRNGLIRLMRMGGVWLAAAFCLASLASAWSFCRESLRLRALGVPRVKGLRAHTAWSFAGGLIFFASASTALAALGLSVGQTGLLVLPGMLLAAWIGQRLHQLPPDNETAKAEERRAMSILQDEDDQTGA